MEMTGKEFLEQVKGKSAAATRDIIDKALAESFADALELANIAPTNTNESQSKSRALIALGTIGAAIKQRP